MEMYLKVKKGICPKCGAVREVVEQGWCYRRRRIERPVRLVGHKCNNCGDFKLISKEGLTNPLENGIMNV